MKNPEVTARARRMLGDLDKAEEHLAQDPEDVFAHIVDPDRESAKVKAIIGADPEETEQLLAQDRKRREEITEGARSAVNKMKNQGDDADLTPVELISTEAIIIVLGRPAILIQDGRFFPPPDPWTDLENHRSQIETNLASVGRIEVDGHPRLPWVGTGFLVADDVVMTNRHVAKEFISLGSDKLRFEAGMSVFVDFKEEFGSALETEYACTEIIGVHDDYDMALLRVEASGDASSLAPPLKLSGSAPASSTDHRAYVVGYPAADPTRNDASVMDKIFGGIYDVKRLQPGEIRAVDEGSGTLAHDCSTLGGNSGSCLIDLDTHQVIGLHFRGKYREENGAVALWMLQEDSMLRDAGVSFTK
jgi:V8-like Glu-specific endopeptidase